jgi:hypothetical protein
VEELKHMDNPWLNIPASDYEGHMGLPEVDQWSFLGDLLKESLDKYDSRSFAYLGCTTGNVLEYLTKDYPYVSILPHNAAALEPEE